MIPVKHRAVPNIPETLHTYPKLLQHIYSARGIQDPSETDKNLSALIPYHTLTDIDKASQRLGQALKNQEAILIVGDFDADGATATALAISALRAMGAKHVDYLVPNRFEYGYGLSAPLVDVAVATKSPKLIITVDNGISSIEGVDRANMHGVDVIVTDHHLPGNTLPNAYAIVNPNQKGDAFESKSIAGVGVIFYLMLALRRYLVDMDWFSTHNFPPPNMASFLDLVALGTVADVVPLDKNNRILVQVGLDRIRAQKCRFGIQALLEIASRTNKNVTENDLGFAIGPRLNAAGRLKDMSLGIECLLAEEKTRALSLATELNNMNLERRIIEQKMKDQAFEVLQRIQDTLPNYDHIAEAICLMDPTWHQGVIGILAGRLKEHFNRPTAIFALVENQELKASLRSVPNLHIRDILAAIDAEHPGLITKFGGHAMAAGLTMPLSHFERFQKIFTQEVAKHRPLSACAQEYITDGPLEPDELHLDTAVLIKNHGPWGQSFPEPTFDNLFHILEQRLVGNHHLKLTLSHEKGSDPIEAIAFFVDTNIWPNYRAKRIHCVYKLDINTYGNRTSLQLMVDALESIED